MMGSVTVPLRMSVPGLGRRPGDVENVVKDLERHAHVLAKRGEACLCLVAGTREHRPKAAGHREQRAGLAPAPRDVCVNRQGKVAGRPLLVHLAQGKGEGRVGQRAHRQWRAHVREFGECACEEEVTHLDG